MGPYSNEANGGSGGYLPDPEWDGGQWLQDPDGILYIIPLNGDDIGGPDGETQERILAALRASGADCLDEKEKALLGMTEVSPALRRFSPETGYYSA